MKKFKLTGESKVNAFGITLFRIQCTVAIEKFGIKPGDLGGWIESEDVNGNARVAGNAWVAGNAEVFGNARVFGNAWVSGNARVFGDVEMFGNAEVFGNARVSGNARVAGNAEVFGNARVSGNARVLGDVEMFGNARVFGNAWVSGNAEVKKARDICWFSVFGSGNRTTTAYRAKAGIEIKCGCFEGSLSAFMEKIKQTHGDNDYAAEYLAICEVIKVRFGIKNNE